jgi:hypothetical protein
LRIKEQETHLILHEHDDDNDDDDEVMRFLNPNWCPIRGFVDTFSTVLWAINWPLK